MIGNMLRAPLIKSATLLGVVTLLVYLTATSSEGSLWNTFGTLFVATLRGVQLGLGLVVSLLFCMAVLFGIFLGCVAMISRESAVKIVERLRREVSERLLFVRSLVIRDVPSTVSGGAVAPDPGLKEELFGAMERSLAAAREQQACADEKIETLGQRLDTMDQREHTDIRLERQADHIQDLAAQAEELREQLKDLQGKVEELSSRSTDEQLDSVLAGLGSRQDSFEMSVAALKEELARIRESSIADNSPGKSAGPAEPVEHRLFSHLANKEMQARIENLVTETLDSDMSYAQVIDHLLANAKGKAADVIAAHPSLAKDYIRYRRNNG